MKNTKIYIWILLPILVFLCNFTFAANEVSISGFTQLFELGGNMLYIILWPLLVITWLALGNDLALGSVFGLDVVLYKFWLLMRNFASLALVGIILYEIIQGMRDGKVADTVKRIPKYILAGVLIPASRWFVPFMLSVSNLLISGIGELPLSFSNQFASTTTKRTLTVHTYLNLTDKIQTADFFRFAAYYGNGGDYYITCPFKRPKIIKSDKTIDLQSYDAIYKNIVDDQIKKIKDTNGVIISSDYCAIDQHLIVKLDYETAACQAIDNKDAGGSTAAASVDCIKAYIWDSNWKYTTNPEYLKLLDDGSSKDTKIKEWNATLQWADSNGAMVWPLYTIYASLMNFSTISSSNQAAMTDAKLIEHMMKLLVTSMAIIPLVWLAVIAMVRVGVIWLLMAFSPFIALLNSLYGSKWADAADKTKFWWWWWVAKMSRSIWEIVNLMLQPVIIIFWLSLGLVFLTTIQYKISDDAGWSLGFMWMDLGKSSNGTQSINTQNVSINIKTNPDSSGDNIFFNLFHWMIMNIFGIVIMRQIWMMSMKFSSSSITEKITGQVTDFAKWYVWSRPIIPVPINWKMQMMSIDWLSSGIKDGTKIITDKRFPKDETYKKSWLAAKLDDRKARWSKARDEENKNVIGSVDIANNAAITPDDKMKKLVDIVWNSKFSEWDLAKADISQSSGMKYAATKLWWYNWLNGSLEAMASDSKFAKALFDKDENKTLWQFGWFSTWKALDEKIMNSLKDRQIKNHDTKTQLDVSYYVQYKDWINIIKYDEKEKKFDSVLVSLPKKEKIEWINLSETEFNNLEEFRDKIWLDEIKWKNWEILAKIQSSYNVKNLKEDKVYKRTRNNTENKYKIWAEVI